MQTAHAESHRPNRLASLYAAPAAPGLTDVPRVDDRSADESDLSQRAAVETVMYGTTWERTRLAARALRALLKDPEQTEMVLILGLSLNRGRVGELLTQLMGTESGNWLLQNQPSISSEGVDYDALRRLPEGTLGREYVRFLDDNELEADFFQAPPGLAPLMQFVSKRMRQTHDVWHTVTGYGSDPGGEVELQAFTYAQLRAPSSAIIALTGSVRGLRDDALLPIKAMRAFRRGRRAEKFAPVIWEHQWERPLAEIRAELGVQA